MSEEKYFILQKSMIDLKSGDAIHREMQAVTEEQYNEWLKPLAKILAEDFVNDLVEGKIVKGHSEH